MEFRNIQHLLTCPICFVQYNDSNHAPLIVPCSNGHTICRHCAQKIIANKDKINCPLDKQAIELKRGDISIFRQSLDLKAFISHFNQFQFCQDHPHSLLEIFCLTCKTNICYRCEKLYHQKHKTEELESVRDKAQNAYSRLKGCLASMNKTIGQRKKYIEKKEAQVIQEFEEKLNNYIDELLDKGDKVIEEIKAHFAKYKNNGMLETSRNVEMMKWKRDTEQELLSLNPEMLKKIDINLVPYTLFDQEEEMKKLDMEKWIKEEQETYGELKAQINKINFEFDKEFEKMLKEMPLGQMKLPDKLEGFEEEKGIETKAGDCKFFANLDESEKSEEEDEDLDDEENLLCEDDFVIEKPSKNKMKRKKLKQMKIRLKV